MTIVVDVDSLQRAQVIKQMNKLINVLQANDLTEGPAVIRELVLLRIHTAQESRTAVLKEAEIFGGRVVDSSGEGFAIEVTGDPEKLGEFVDVMHSDGNIGVTGRESVAVPLEPKSANCSRRSLPRLRIWNHERSFKWLNAITKKTENR